MKKFVSIFVPRAINAAARKEASPATPLQHLVPAPEYVIVEPVRRMGLIPKLLQLGAIGAWRILSAAPILDSPGRVRNGDPHAFRRTRNFSAWAYAVVIPVLIYTQAGALIAAPFFVLGFLLLARRRAANQAIDLPFSELLGLWRRIVTQSAPWRTVAIVTAIVFAVSGVVAFFLSSVAQIALGLGWVLALVLTQAAVLKPVSEAAGEDLEGPLEQRIAAIAGVVKNKFSQLRKPGTALAKLNRKASE